MEVKVNQEIREYAESMFFGLSIRQFFFSLLAVITAAVLYFALENKVGTEMVSWICIAGAVPFAAMGFVKYHDMHSKPLSPMEELIAELQMAPDEVVDEWALDASYYIEDHSSL